MSGIAIRRLCCTTSPFRHTSVTWPRLPGTALPKRGCLWLGFMKGPFTSGPLLRTRSLGCRSRFHSSWPQTQCLEPRDPGAYLEQELPLSMGLGTTQRVRWGTRSLTGTGKRAPPPSVKILKLLWVITTVPREMCSAGLRHLIDTYLCLVLVMYLFDWNAEGRSMEWCHYLLYYGTQRCDKIDLYLTTVYTI